MSNSVSNDRWRVTSCHKNIWKTDFLLEPSEEKQYLLQHFLLLEYLLQQYLLQHFLSKGAHSLVVTTWFTYHAYGSRWNTAATWHTATSSFFLNCLFSVKLLYSLQHMGCQYIYTAIQDFLPSCILQGSYHPFCSGVFSRFVYCSWKKVCCFKHPRCYLNVFSVVFTWLSLRPKQGLRSTIAFAECQSEGQASDQVLDLPCYVIQDAPSALSGSS